MSKEQVCECDRKPGVIDIYYVNHTCPNCGGIIKPNYTEEVWKSQK